MKEEKRNIELLSSTLEEERKRRASEIQADPVN
jgi:hypothetical protein